MSGAVDVKVLTDQDIVWDHRDGPRFRLAGTYLADVIDPFPGYPHDPDLVRAMAHKVSQAFPIGADVTFYVAARESTRRGNGWTELQWLYGDVPDGDCPFSAHIVLSGKRMPPHPAVTRYLVAHEYGHAVAHWLDHALGLDMNTNEVVKVYAKLRGLDPEPPSYGGGTWHLQPGEVIADDFRILVAGVETDFWPHPGVTRPEHVPDLADWWAQQTHDTQLVEETAS